MDNLIEIFQSKDNQIELKVQFDTDTVWLNQAQMSDLFGKERTVITKHINNIFKEGELDSKVVCASFAHTTKHGAIASKTQEISNEALAALTLFIATSKTEEADIVKHFIISILNQRH